MNSGFSVGVGLALAFALSLNFSFSFGAKRAFCVHKDLSSIAAQAAITANVMLEHLCRPLNQSPDDTSRKN